MIESIADANASNAAPDGAQTTEFYVNPEFFSPKEISNMVAGFALQAYLALFAKGNPVKIEAALDLAVDVVSLALNNDYLGGSFERRSQNRRLTYDVLADARTRLDQAAADNAKGFGP